jgi:hypothetical protein
MIAGAADAADGYGSTEAARDAGGHIGLLAKKGRVGRSEPVRLKPSVASAGIAFDGGDLPRMLEPRRAPRDCW